MILLLTKPLLRIGLITGMVTTLSTKFGAITLLRVSAQQIMVMALGLLEHVVLRPILLQRL